jgi:hypothetical protein
LALEGHQDPHLHYLGRDFETRKFLHDIESREPCL